MNWRLSYRADPAGAALADRHYTRQSVGSPQFVPPSTCVVLTADRAVWATSWPLAEYVKHAWPGAWICSIFRNEGTLVSSLLIREAVAATRWTWPEVPALGLVTFVDSSKVPAIRRRGELIYGYCFLKAGFRHIGFTKAGLWAWQLRLSFSDPQKATIRALLKQAIDAARRSVKIPPQPRHQGRARRAVSSVSTVGVVTPDRRSTGNLLIGCARTWGCTIYAPKPSPDHSGVESTP